MEQIKKIKVAMICHFSNSEVRPFLPLKKRRLYHYARHLLGLSPISNGHGDLAPWDTSLINYLLNRDDIDLHVISAYSSLKKRIVSFENRGAYYYFVSSDNTALLKHIASQPKWWLKFSPMVRDIHQLVDKISPDIVLLVGLENSDYSSTVIGINKYPVYGLCQTIYNNPDRAHYSSVDKFNSFIEHRIFQEHKYFGVYCKMHYDLLKQYKPDGIVFKFGFPSNGIILAPTPTRKEYDFVNFALTLDLRKGAHDSIRAIAIVKEKYPDIKLNLVGGCTAERKEELDTLVKELGVEGNVIYTPFFEKRSDLYLHIQRSRFAVLPCKMDNISGTMTQSMQLGLPLVVYKTTGTSGLNREKRCALIAEHSNVEDLAAKMTMLMDDSMLADTLKTNAREYQEKRAEYNRHNGDRLVDNLKAIIANYNNGTSIPQEQLFNPERDD